MYGSLHCSSDDIIVKEISDFSHLPWKILSKAHTVFKTFLQDTLLDFLALETQEQSASIKVQ